MCGEGGGGGGGEPFPIAVYMSLYFIDLTEMFTCITFVQSLFGRDVEYLLFLCWSRVHKKIRGGEEHVISNYSGKPVESPMECCFVFILQYCMTK